jgi:hypothetical protein
MHVKVKTNLFLHTPLAGVDKVTLGHVIIRVLWSSPLSNISTNSILTAAMLVYDKTADQKL